MIITKSYSELIRFPTFEERFRYLKLDGSVGKETFGHSRWLNQEFYHSAQWRRFRDTIIIRDNGCDLGVEGYEVNGPIIIHHINPITIDDIVNMCHCVFDPENAICVRPRTHNAIHYGDESQLLTAPIERRAGDTCPWRRLV